MMITLTNDFHDTETKIQIRRGNYLSPRRCRDIRNRLCGISGCACGDDLGRCGPQTENAQFIQPSGWDGHYVFA